MIEHLPKQCPLCGAGVSQSRFAELQAQIHEEERRKLEEAMAAAREELDRAHREALEAQAAAFRTQTVKSEAQRAAEVKAAVDAAAVESERRHRDQLAAVTSNAAAETAERVRLEKEVADLEAKAKASTEAKDAAVKAALEETERLHREELAKQRTIFEKDRDEQLLKEKLLRLEDDQRMQKRLADMQRQIEKKTADELGHGPEVDLYQAVQEEFKDDRVIHIAKGEAGADIRLEVMHRGELCGTIILDSKNRKQWQDRYAGKLDQDRVDAKAEYAVLATNVFPSGVNDLCLRPGVIVTRPLMVVSILRILRSSLVSNHVHRLSAQQREQKAAKVYEYINGADFRQTLASAMRASEQLEELDLDEQRDHENMWRKRGKLERDIIKALGNAESRVNEIIEGSGEEVAALSAPRSA